MLGLSLGGRHHRWDDAINGAGKHRALPGGGFTKVHAALSEPREITSPQAASIAILAIFMPVIFMQGIVGKFFLPVRITISSPCHLPLRGATIAPCAAPNP